MIEYLPKSSEQLLTIVYSVGIGFALGFIYEILRLIFYLLSGSDKKFTLLRDIIFLLFVFTVTFFFFLVRCNGKVTFYAVAGEALGGFAAFKMIDPFMSYLIRKRLRKLRKKLAKLHDIGRRVSVFTEKIKKKEKNIAKGKKNSENDLHNQYEIVYNQSVTVRPLSDETENRGD